MLGYPHLSILNCCLNYQFACADVQARLIVASMQVSPGDIVVSEKIRDVDVNDKVKLARVMMLGSRHETIIGRPLIPQASITAVVEVRAHPVSLADVENGACV